MTYKHSQDERAGRDVADYFYSNLSLWYDRNQPPADFIGDFDRFFAAIEHDLLSPADLIDLGIMQTAEAIQSFMIDDGSDRITLFYLGEARMPFFARVDEDAYRQFKQHEFLEIDFQIFEIIHGDFPHYAAQQFLLENEWVDVWLVLRYLDSLDDFELELDLFEQIIRKRDAYHEQLILFAYLLVVEPDLVRALIEKNGAPSGLNLPSDISIPLMQTALRILEECIEDGELKATFEELLPPELEKEGLFLLLALFEITHAHLGPGWVRLLERAASNLWAIHLSADDEEVVNYQPIAEFAGSIISLLPDDDLEHVLRTSLLLPIFFEHIAGYNPEAFHNLIMPLAAVPEIFIHELEMHLPEIYTEDVEDDVRLQRMRMAAQSVGHDLLIKDGRVTMVRRMED
ncbi:MAG: hypothetical protein KDK34_01400 [Leptospiraceae bacterium]|nr:hypothetical protein [Leptospiraceae bacterium]